MRPQFLSPFSLMEFETKNLKMHWPPNPLRAPLRKGHAVKKRRWNTSTHYEIERSTYCRALRTVTNGIIDRSDVVSKTTTQQAVCLKCSSASSSRYVFFFALCCHVHFSRSLVVRGACFFKCVFRELLPDSMYFSRGFAYTLRTTVGQGISENSQILTNSQSHRDS